MHLDWYFYVSLIMAIALIGYFVGVFYGRKVGQKKLPTGAEETNLSDIKKPE